MTTDEQLMRAVANGDRLAYETLVRRHLGAISHYAWRMLGNGKDTEDIAQETFLRLWLNAAQWQAGKSKVGTWLHRIAHNLCVDYLRKQGRMSLGDDLDADGSWQEAKPGGFAAGLTGRPLADDGAEATETRQRLLAQALADLPAAQREAIALCHFGGHSNKQAAQIMNLSVKALESCLVRARRTLKERLAQAEA